LHIRAQSKHDDALDNCAQELKKKILQLQKDSQAKSMQSTATKPSQAAQSAPPAKPVAHPQQQRVAGAAATAATAVAGGGAGQQPVAQRQQQQVYYPPVVSMRQEEAVRYAQPQEAVRLSQRHLQPVQQEMRLVGYEPKYEVVNVPAQAYQQQLPPYQQQRQPYHQQPQLLTSSGAYAAGQQFSGQRTPAQVFPPI